MNALIQLLRRPAFLVTILVLLTVSSGFFILSSGVFFSTLAVSDEMEQRFVVAAFPTDELVRYSKKFDNAEILYYDSAMFESERIALSNIIKDPGLVEQVYHLKFSCGYSPELRSLVSAEFPGKYQIYGEKDYPYFRNTVLLAEIKEIKEPVTVRTSFPLVDSTGEVEYRRGVRVFVELSAELQEVISLHPGYKVRDKIRATLNFDSMEEYRNAGLEEGRRFYFIGEFNDISLARITENFVRLNLPHEGIRLEDHLRMLTEEELEKERELSETYGYPPAVAMIWNEKERRGIPLTEEELEEHYISDLDCRYVIPYSRDSEYPSEVRKAAESAERTHHSFPVLGTDYLERLYEFHLGELFLTEGRSFTRQEYESGETLCIISEQMAQINGLTVGDKIPLSFFLTEEKLRGILLFYRHPNYVLSHEIEHQGEVGEPREFRIIGLYRAKNVWNFDFFSITPNTVFIPNKAMPSAHLKLDRGHFQTIVVNRDAVEAFQDKMKESRIRSSVVSVHDNGYAELKPVLKSFRASGLWLMLIASAVCILMLSAYLFLFVLREKRTVGLMISLGAGQRYTMRKMFVISMIPVVVATVVGTAVGMLLTSGVLNTIYMDAVQEAEISEEPAVHITAAIRTFPLIGSVLYLAVYAFFVWLTVRLLTKKSPLELLKAKV